MKTLNIQEIYKNELWNQDIKKPNKSNTLKKIRTYAGEYCNYTGIHGFRYMGEKRSHSEKICWTLIFILSLSVCLGVIYKSYVKWMNSPLIVNFASEEVNIYEIPFPSVTICQEVKISRSYFNYSHNMIKLVNQDPTLDDDGVKKLQFMSLLCDTGKIYQDFIPNITIISEEFYSFLEEGKYKFLETCCWMGKTYNCDEIFEPTLTDEGLCLSFNMLNQKEIYHDTVIPTPYVQRSKAYRDHQSGNWSVEHGYSYKAGVTTYPRRAQLAGSTNALVVNLNASIDDLDYACTKFQGFQVVLHLPVSFPSVQQHYLRVPLGKSVIVAITPRQMRTSDDVQQYSGDRRKCWTQSEAKLKYFRNYTQNNCNMECLTEHTFKHCGCVAYYMPRTNNTKICGNEKRACIKSVRDYLEMSDLYTSIHNRQDGEIFNEQMKCHCMPMCTHTDYITEITEIDYNWFKEYESVGDNRNRDEKYSVSQLVVYFRSNHFIPYERNELYGNDTFLANVGGLLGLFVGFSLLSLFEIVYFLSIRILCNLKLYKRWYGEDKP